jgi:hypothetical protein
MRRLFVVGGAAVLMVAVPWVVVAGPQGGRTPINCMDTVWLTTAASTSSTQWSTVPGLTRRPAAIFPIAVNVSALVSGAPVDFRVLSTNVGGQTHSSKPGATRFAPGAGSNSFGYQWVERNISSAVHVNFLRLQWRSPSGNPVHLTRGDMSVIYATDACDGQPV